MNTIATDKQYLVIGLGLTGVSCARYLLSQGKNVAVMDSRKNPPQLDAFISEFPNIPVHLGFKQDILNSAHVLVMSPGVPLATPEIQEALTHGAMISSDIELFLEQFTGKVIAITGSNAKSTVTAWLGEAIQLSGRKVLVAGNIGNPVLDSAGEQYDVAVLELSSFQLELIRSLGADVATILNISEDHMDRYDSMAAYIQAKQKIYFGCKTAVFNREDVLTQPLVPDSVTLKNFGLNSPDLNMYGIQELDGELFLVSGFDIVMPSSELSLKGRHNVANALSVLALADAVNNDRDATIAALKQFEGLKYRCQFVGEYNGIQFVNDSKATNVGSTIAALKGLVSKDRANLILMLGGQSKGQDLSPLKPVIQQCCKKVLTFGEDRHLFNELLSDFQTVATFESAFRLALDSAKTGDIILLSPACASFDEFSNFEARGEAFNKLIGALI